MITFIMGYKNMLAVRKKATKDFFEMMDEHLRKNQGCECIIADYGSNDGIKEYLESYRSIHLPVEPNPDQYLNLPKCFNKATTLSKNNIIAPIGADMRFNQKLIEGVIEFFTILGEMILRVLCIKLDKKGKPFNTTFSPYFLWKEHIIKSGGYDERIHGWGKEDDDIMERIYKYQNVLEIRVRNLKYYHIWHDDSFKNQYDDKELLKNRNSQIAIENILTNGKNLVNSYW